MAGDLGERSPVDLCLHLAGERATGTLVMAGPRGEAVLVFADGQLAGSRPADTRTNKLGERLVSAGRLDRPDLDALLAEQSSDPTAPPLGQMLIDRGLATADAVRLFVQEQVLETLLDSIGWFEGTWDFQDADTPAAGPGGGLRVPVDRALMEVRRRAAERERIAAVVASPAAVPVTTGTTGDGVELSTDAFTVLTAVDGERSVGEIAHALGTSYDETARQLYRLVLQERIRFADTSRTNAADATPEEAALTASSMTGAPPVELADRGWAERRQIGTTTAEEPEPWVGWADAASRQRAEAPASMPPASPPPPAAPPSSAPPPAPQPPAPGPAASSAPLWSQPTAGQAAPAPPRADTSNGAAPAAAPRDLDADTRRELFSELHEMGRSHPGFAESPEPEPAREPEPDQPSATADAVPTDPAPSSSLSGSDVSDLLRELHALNLDD